MRRSSTKGTEPSTFVRYDSIWISPQCRPLFLVTCCVLVRCVLRKRSASCWTAHSWAFLAPEWTVQVQTWSPITSSWNFLQPQVTRDFSVMTGIWTHGHGKESLPETSRPGFIFTLRPDLSQPTHKTSSQTLKFLFFETVFCPQFVHPPKPTVHFPVCWIVW
jgi:hypothetical protein